jgi:hypothetical protein
VTETNEGQRPPPLADSPWLWLYLLSTYYPRQSQVERQYQGKVRAAQAAAGAEPDMDMSTPESTQSTLTPLFILFSVIWICAWPLVWWTLKKRSAAPPSS